MKLYLFPKATNNFMAFFTPFLTDFTNMEEPKSNSTQDLFGASLENTSQITMKASPAEPEEKADWLPLPGSLSNTTVESTCPIQPGQKNKSPQKTPVSWKTTIKRPKDYERDKVGKYVPYFKDNIVLPILGISDLLELGILSLVVMDLKTRRLAGLAKDIFEELLQTADIPAKYFCRSFATWDVLLPTRKQVAKLAESCITTKFFLLQHKYISTRSIRVTVCNAPANLTGHVVASFLSSYRKVEEVTQL